MREVHGKARSERDLSDFPYILKEMKRLIRMKHYSFSTGHTYLGWTKRFFAYMEEAKKGASRLNGLLLFGLAFPSNENKYPLSH